MLCSTKRVLNAFAKSINPSRLARTVQDEMGRYLSLSLPFLYVE